VWRGLIGPSEMSDVGETSSKASFMDQPSSIADIDSKKRKLLDGVIEARGWREHRKLMICEDLGTTL
jgi:hypothetical protein